eukprot:PhM_4_TR9643/c0_g1_i1/m.106421
MARRGHRRPLQMLGPALPPAVLLRGGDHRCREQLVGAEKPWRGVALRDRTRVWAESEPSTVAKCRRGPTRHRQGVVVRWVALVVVGSDHALAAVLLLPLTVRCGRGQRPMCLRVVIRRRRVAVFDALMRSVGVVLSGRCAAKVPAAPSPSQHPQDPRGAEAGADRYRERNRRREVARQRLATLPRRCVLDEHLLSERHALLDEENQRRDLRGPVPPRLLPHVLHPRLHVLGVVAHDEVHAGVGPEHRERVLHSVVAHLDGLLVRTSLFSLQTHQKHRVGTGDVVLDQVQRRRAVVHKKDHVLPVLREVQVQLLAAARPPRRLALLVHDNALHLTVALHIHHSEEVGRGGRGLLTAGVLLALVPLPRLIRVALYVEERVGVVAGATCNDGRGQVRHVVSP